MLVLQPLLVGFILFIGIIIIGFNYWHAMKCVEINGIGDSRKFLSAMEERIADVESQVRRSAEKTQKLMKEIQDRALTFDEYTLNSLTNSAKDSAILMSLKLSTVPTAPQTQYLVDDKEKTQENKWDDLFNEFKDGKAEYDDPIWKENEYAESEFFPARNEAEQINRDQAVTSCQKWKEQYEVKIGTSWGRLPEELKLRWKEENCDYYFS